jgi:hypothetical protein
MGMNSSIYVGPYVEYPSIKETIGEEIRSCGEHQDLRGASFCWKCGGEIKTITVPREYHVHIGEIVGDDEFMQIDDNDETTILITNYGGIGMKVDEHEYRAVRPITPEFIKEEMEKFRIKHQSHLTKLENRLGMSLVIKFGYTQRWG